MENNSTTAEELKTIRTIMEESTKFLSLSGFAGVFMGLAAIAGAIAAHIFILDGGNIKLTEYYRSLTLENGVIMPWNMIIIAMVVLIVSIIIAYSFSLAKAKKSGMKILSPVSRRLLVNLMIPLVSGGLFVIILMLQSHFQLIIPSLLIFYGLALINAGKFTYSEVFYLGVIEIVTGLISAFFPAQGLIFWSMGFGIVHILYGLFMYRKYEA
jgi:hypothetical protein